MLLPRVIAAALALRQTLEILPTTYCSPQCPACLTNIKEFNETTACVGTSPFILNCGTCQTCVGYYAIQNGTVDRLSEIQSILSAQLNRCANTSASAEVAAIASQVARISPSTIASSPTATATPDDASTASAPSATTTNPSTSTTSSSKTSSAAAGPGPQLNQTWVAGPVIGSILGMSTVFVVIYCTRRKQRREEEWELGNLGPKEVKEEDEESAAATLQPPAPEDNEGGKAQLHSECIPVREMENTEVIPPVELPALEPVGQEMLTPRGDMETDKEWPLPISPLPALFASAEIRDERMGVEESPKHETFYHP